ncbi:hypothetical protein BJ165DRAFT_1458196 [Panaeolus papilionaceus]|nr:hypothetical protein BJ165DRAFT_1458196 [Panaeolus papilionaceus]
MKAIFLSSVVAALSVLNVSTLTAAIPPPSYTGTSTFGCWVTTVTIPPPVPTGAIVPPFGQCGGIGYTGPTQCSDGTKCLKYGDISKCIPDPGATPPATRTITATACA